MARRQALSKAPAPAPSPPEARTVLCEGKHMRLVRLGRWEFAERSVAAGAVVILAITPDQNVVLTEQFRIPVGRRVIELPAGLVGDIPEQAEEAWEDAARRELLEETGYQARQMRRVASGPISAGFGTEMLEFFVATGLKKVEAGGGVEGEDIQIHEVPLSRVSAWLKRKAKAGVMIDPKIYAGLFFAKS